MRQSDPDRRLALWRCLAGAFAFVLLVPVFVAIALLDGFLHPRRTRYT